LDLTFRSVQEHDSRVDRLAKNPDLMLLALQSPDMRLALRGVAAYSKFLRRYRRLVYGQKKTRLDRDSSDEFIRRGRYATPT
jgi:hypothetical protein